MDMLTRAGFSTPALVVAVITYRTTHPASLWQKQLNVCRGVCLTLAMETKIS